MMFCPRWLPVTNLCEGEYEVLFEKIFLSLWLIMQNCSFLTVTQALRSL